MNNKKKLFLGIAGVGILGLVGAGVGMMNRVNAVETKAATSETMIYIDARLTHWVTSWGATNADINIKTWGSGDQYHYDASTGKGTATIGGVEYITFDRSNYSTQTAGLIYAYNTSSAQNQSSNFSFSEASEGQNLLTLSGGTDSVGPTLVWGTLDVGTTYTVTKYAVINGVLDDSVNIGEDVVEEGDTYAIPSRINRDGYHFAGWFRNEECTTPYVAGEIDADLTLYAKYVTLSKDSYIYYITDRSTATTNMIHTWGGDNEYGDRDVLITGITGVQEVHGVTRFRNTNYLIYKIPFSSESGDTSFKFHENNWDDESSEKTLVAGNAYQWGTGEIATDEVAGGDALDFILEFEGIRNAVAAGAGIKAYSICGISAANASSLCTKYNGLSGTARGYVDASYTYTYKKDDASVNDNVTFYDMMEELAKKAGGVALNGHAASWSGVSAISSETNNGVIIALVAAAVATVTVGGAIMIRRRKEN